MVLLDLLPGYLASLKNRLERVNGWVLLARLNLLTTVVAELIECLLSFFAARAALCI